MTWDAYYKGDGEPRDVDLPTPPPWRTFGRGEVAARFQPPDGLVDAVNAALFLKRPLLITGAPGSGKSTVVTQVATELKLGPVLSWHITSRSTLTEGLYRYDALGRIHAQQLDRDRAGKSENPDAIEPFLRLGPLGTALVPAGRPRALLIDEIDKSDLDLPSDLLDVLEHGRFEIPELVRYKRNVVSVRLWGDTDDAYPVTRGKIQCDEFPFVVMTSNGDQTFPAPFLRRCVRYSMPIPDRGLMVRLVEAHLGITVEPESDQRKLINRFVDRLERGDALAADQLLNAVLLLSSRDAPNGEDGTKMERLLLQELSGG